MARRVVVGLGNPGPRYAGTRHNVGFAVALRLVDRLAARALPRADEYDAWEAALPDAPEGRIAIVTPLLYMNRSGDALAAFRERHGLTPGDCLVAVDDVYLPLGALRLRGEGGAGGHNGLESVRLALETTSFPRLRIGVGRGEEAEALHDRVLAPFEEDEGPALGDALERATEAARTWAVEGITAAMNRFNARPRPAPNEDSETER